MSDQQKEPKEQNWPILLLQAVSKRRWRLNQWQKDLAVVNGWQLRKRGRPRKSQKKAGGTGRA
jgi:hypothetical protein